MLVHSLRTYMFTFLCWRLVTQSVNNGNGKFSVPENMYLRISEACRALAHLRTSTDADVLELQNTVSVLQIKSGKAIWYPISKYIVPVKDITVKHYLIRKPLRRSNFNEYTNTTNNDIFVWVPINESLVKLDEKMQKWIPIAEPVNRNRSDDPTVEWHSVNKSLLYHDDSMFKWFPINNTLVKLNNSMTYWYPTNETQNELTIKWFPINESMVRIDDMKVSWQPLNGTDDSQYNAVRTLNKAGLTDDTTTNWYKVNDSHVAIKRPDINVTRETKIIIHGFQAAAINDVTLDLAHAFHKLNRFNVLLIDAENMLGKTYFKCVKNARLLGKAIADLIIHLESFGANALDFHLLGISLGAHVSGWAGKYFRHSTGRRIGRITGLDSAGPCFTRVPSDERLDKADGLYVDVIHTNSLVQGLFEPHGHADFYLNGGGPSQPGCLLPFCSHLMAAYAYTESISRPHLFVAVKCDSWAQFQNRECSNQTAFLGHGSTADTRGTYYLRTSENEPYGLGMKGLRPEKWY